MDTTEDDAENFLVVYCELRRFRHTHFSNETYTTSWKQKRKMKYLGVNSGAPDHLVLVRRTDGSTVPAYIEMKREKGGVISDTQFAWIHDLLAANQFATVCAGGEKAVEYVQAIENFDTPTIQKFHDNFQQKYEKWAEKKKKKAEKYKNNPNSNPF